MDELFNKEFTCEICNSKQFTIGRSDDNEQCPYVAVCCKCEAAYTFETMQESLNK